MIGAIGLILVKLLVALLLLAADRDGG